MEPEFTPAAASYDWFTRLGIKAFRYRALVRRRWWILAVAVSIGFAYESWVLMQQPVRYESDGRLMVGGNIEVSTNSKYTGDVQDGFNYTQITILQSPEIRDRAQRSLALKAPQIGGTAEITAAIIPRSNFFTVTGRGSNPEYTRLFVDAVMDEYIKFRLEQKTTAGSVTMQQISEQLANTEKDLDQRRKNLAEFTMKNDMGAWEEQRKTWGKYLLDLKTQQANKTAELQLLQNMTSDQLLNRTDLAVSTGTTPGVGTQSPASPDSTVTSDLSSQYLQASQELAQKQADLEEKSKVWKPKHPKLIAIKEDIERLQRLIKTIKGQHAEGTQARIASLKAELKSLDASIEVWDKKVMEVSRKDAEYQMLQSAVTSDENMKTNLVASIQSIGLGTKTGTDIVSVFSHATAPVKVPPGTVKHLLLGFILGLGAGCAILFLIDRADDRVSSSTEMIEYFSEPILGQIPNVEASRVEAGLPLLCKDDQRFPFAESFRSLRSSLIFMPGQGELRTLIITSSIPSEGKSTIASNLAITMAAAGARVLLVDADLRRGDLSALFDTDGRTGLSDVLRGETEWKAALQKTKYPTLSLLPRGPVTNQSGELLLVPIFDALLQEFKAGYDLTVFNTSPILATDDTATIAPNFDGTLMVIRAGFTSARLAQNSLNALYQRQVNVLGMILNCVDTEMPDYHYYRYPKYYAA